METEQTLLRRLSGGDTEALEILMDRFTSYVFTVLRSSLGSFTRAEDVEELASNVFFKLWCHRKRLNTLRLKSWLGKVAANEAKSWLRTQKLETVSDSDWFELPERSDVRFEDAEERKLLAETALSLLDEETRAVFVLYYAERRTVAEIAALQGMKIPTVKSRLQRGRGLLRKALKAED